MKNACVFAALVFSSLVACQPATDLSIVYAFPEELAEVSGMVYVSSDQSIWTLQDKGNPAELLNVNSKGEIQQRLAITHFPNRDWEELAADPNGDIYIGDFGNNNQNRRDLQIARISKDSLANPHTRPVQITRFYYPEQTDFTANKKKKSPSFNCESMLVTADYFYLVTKVKNWRTQGPAVIYRIPNQAGNFAAEKWLELEHALTSPLETVTGAALSPSGKTAALLSHRSVYTFTMADLIARKTLELQHYSLGHQSQKEAMVFTSESELLLSDEREKQSQNYVYRFSIPPKP